MSVVTIAKMIQLHESKPIFLAFDFMSIEGFPVCEEEFALMILTPSTRIIRIFPTRGSEVLKTTIEIGPGGIFERIKINRQIPENSLFPSCF
jgi:hypothetical protein